MKNVFYMQGRIYYGDVVGKGSNIRPSKGAEDITEDAIIESINFLRDSNLEEIVLLDANDKCYKFKFSFEEVDEDSLGVISPVHDEDVDLTSTN